jgi:SAM-dependent methyltransferase
VTAVDVSPTVLDRARARAREADPEVAARIDWLQADLAKWSPDGAAYDLVSSQHVHLPAAAQPRLVPTLAAAVAPGGTLLVASHHASDLVVLPDLHGWEVRLDEVDGRTARETVLVARRT